MTTQVLLPKIGFSMTQGSVTEWLVGDGAAVQLGAPLFVVESDKSTNEVEAPASGVLRILKAVGEVVPVGSVVAEIE